MTILPDPSIRTYDQLLADFAGSQPEQLRMRDMVRTMFFGTGVGGDVDGPAGATDGAIALFDGPSGKLLKDSLVTLSSGSMSGVVDLGLSGDITYSKDGAKIKADTADGSDTKSIYITGGGDAPFGGRGAYLALSGNEATAPGNGRFLLTAGSGATSCVISGPGGANAVFSIYNASVDGADSGTLNLQGAGVAASSRGAFFSLYGNEHASRPGQFYMQAGDTATLTTIIGGAAAATAFTVRNATTAGSDTGILWLTGAGNVSGNTRGAYASFAGNEFSGANGRFLIQAGSTNLLSEMIGGSSGAAIVNIRMATADAADTGLLQLTGGGAVNLATRGAYLNLYGDDHATSPGRFTLQAGGNSTSATIIGGNVNPTSITIRNNTADASDFGALFFASGGAITDAGRGAYLNLYGNEYGSGLAGRFLLQAGVTANNATITGGGAAGSVVTIQNGTSDGTDDGITYVAGGGNILTSRGAFLQLFGNENATPGAFNLRAGDTNGASQIIGGSTGATSVQIRMNTVDTADTGSLQLTGGGAVTGITRGAYLNLYGNEAASTPGRFLLQAGDLSTLNEIVGGAGASASVPVMTIRNATADAADNGLLRLSGGGNVGTNTRGGYIDLYGNEHATVPGAVVIAAGLTAVNAYFTGGGAAGSQVHITNGTSDGADSGLTEVAGGGAVGITRGAYMQLYGNEHAQVGNFILVGGDLSNNNRIYGGGGAAALLEIRNQTADASDSGSVLIAAGGATQNNTRGAYINIYGNEHGTNPGHLFLAGGAAASPGQVRIVTSPLILAASTTTYASINFTQGVAPSSPTDGMMWREDNTNTGLKIRIGGVTKTVTVS